MDPLHVYLCCLTVKVRARSLVAWPTLLAERQRGPCPRCSTVGHGPDCCNGGGSLRWGASCEAPTFRGLLPFRGCTGVAPGFSGSALSGGPVSGSGVVREGGAPVKHSGRVGCDFFDHLAIFKAWKATLGELYGGGSQSARHTRGERVERWAVASLIT